MRSCLAIVGLLAGCSSAAPPVAPVAATRSSRPACARGELVQQPIGNGFYRVCIVGGREHGQFESTWDLGVPRARGRYVHGFAVGVWHYWHPNGRLMAEGERHGDSAAGRWRYFTERGEPAAPGIVCVVDRSTGHPIPGVMVVIRDPRLPVEDADPDERYLTTDGLGRAGDSLIPIGAYRVIVIDRAARGREGLLFDGVIDFSTTHMPRVIEVRSRTPPGPQPPFDCTSQPFSIAAF